MALLKLASSTLFSSSICPAGEGASTWNLSREDGLFPRRLEGRAIGSEWSARDLRPFLDRKTDVRLMICVKMSPDCSQIPFLVSASVSLHTSHSESRKLTLFHRFKHILERAYFVLVVHPRCADFKVDSIGERERTMLSSIVALFEHQQC